MGENRLLIKKEKTELKQEAFDLKHPRNNRGQFVSKYDAAKNLEYWNKKWGKKYGVTTAEQDEAIIAMELGLDQEKAKPKKMSIIELLKQ